MIIRACSYKATIKLPEAASTYSKILVTFAQDGAILVEKNKSDLTIDNDTVVVNLTQAETKLFNPSLLAMMQVRCFDSAYNAPGSVVFGIKVCPALDDEVLS